MGATNSSSKAACELMRSGQRLLGRKAVCSFYMAIEQLLLTIARWLRESVKIP
jgi:hypothetical protein